MKSIHAILIGLGMVGSDIVKNSSTKGVDYIGIFDVNPGLIGKPAGDILDISSLNTVIRSVDELDDFFKIMILISLSTLLQRLLSGQWI